MPQWAKYAIAVGIGYFIGSVGGFTQAAHQLGQFLNHL